MLRRPLFFFILLAAGMAQQSSLNGTYYNQLDSKLTLACSGGQLKGTYQTGVGNASGIYPLQGSATQCDAVAATTFGFCVAWNNQAHGNSDSTTCWTGRVIEDGLTTFWILTSGSGPLWSSNRVGQDVFWKSRK